MAHSLSAQKRVRQNETRNKINRARKSQVKTQVKRLEEIMVEGNIEASVEQFRLITKKLDRIASTSTMHKKTAARKKSRLAKRVNALASKKV